MKKALFAFFCLAAFVFADNKWGSDIPGVVRLIPTNEKVIYLTFDACGGGGGYKYDEKLIEFLKAEKIEATLFINSRWIDHNMESFMSLSKNPLFSIQNHGTEHRPLSFVPRRIYGIAATGSAEKTKQEIMGNHEKIKKLTGTAPRFFRSGTAYYDDASVKLAGELGYKIIGFDVLGDGGATFSANKILQNAKKARNGSIFIYHMNQPYKSTFAGIKLAVEYWKSQGFKFHRIDKDF